MYTTSTTRQHDSFVTDSQNLSLFTKKLAPVGGNSKANKK
ncbi:hypothetical protein RV14_GL000855 [Enterococcus ratti]|uniref:Uncharacterized protein n=1 Tax=Enterococcus ratti TaxID=150033 RepID=A0A1L8WFE9_9ENTE|nr:hypothetical protein RV14_GL000855 [Enterococcus ratti]